MKNGGNQFDKGERVRKDERMKETEGKIRKKKEKVENYLGKDRRNQ